MQYTFTFLLTALSVGSTTLCMKPQKTDLTWAFATVSILDKQDAASLTIKGVDVDAQSTATKEQLKHALLTALHAIDLEYVDKQSVEPTVTIDPAKLQLITAALKALENDELARKQLAQQLTQEKAIADATKQAHEAWQEYQKLRNTLSFFTGTTEFWQEHGQEVNNQLEELHKEALAKQTELARTDPCRKRFNPEFKKKYNLESVDTCSMTSGMW